MAISRSERIYKQWPEPVVGYNLNPEHGQFSVVIPEASENLISNPSFETNADGYNVVNCTIARTTDEARRGIASGEITPSANLLAYAYFTYALTSGTTYTFSCDILDIVGQTFNIRVMNGAGTQSSTVVSWIGDGTWKRKSVTYTAGSSENYYMRVERAAVNSTTKFYTDGWQLEVKAYPTTYFDGDSIGFTGNPLDFGWDGIRHGSTSWRSAQTRAGGREMKLLEYGFYLLTIIGLGMAPVVDQSLSMPGIGELYQGTGTQAREFTLVGDIFGDSLRHLQSIRSDLINAFKPDITLIAQPMILRYQACDEDGIAVGDSLDILCTYQTGLEGQIDNNHQERLALTFKMHLPFIRNTYSGGIELGFQTTVADADRILMRGADGIWAALGTGANAVVYVIKQDPYNGLIYIGGAFVDLGDANGDRIVSWNGNAFSSLEGGAASAVEAILPWANGIIYVGGSFAHMHTAAGADIANTAQIAKWDGANWSALLNGMTGATSVNALARGNDGYLYVGGIFTDQGDANGDYIVGWNGSAWFSLGTGGNERVLALAVGLDGSIYAGGLFTAMGGVTNTAYIAKWNGTSWEALGTGMDNYVSALAIAKDGSLIAGGAFHTAGGVTVNHIARWNGSQWLPFGVGANSTVDTLFVDQDGKLYAGGGFTTINGINLPDRMAIYNGSVWAPLDVDLFGTPSIKTLIITKTGECYLGWDGAAGNATSATVIVPNVGSSMAYPIFYMTGPGTIYQIKNYTTGKSVYFNLTLMVGETAVLSLDPMNISFTSSLRGNILSKILPGSDLYFPLIPGNNNISSFFFGSTSANTNISMTWTNYHWSIEGALFK